MERLPSFVEWLDARDWARLQVYGEEVSFDAGELILRRGEPPVWLFVVQQGELEVVDPRTSPPTVLASLSAGQILGEMSFLDGIHVSADVRAVGGVTCTRFSIERLYRLLRQFPELDASFHRAIAHTVSARARLLRRSALLGGFGGGATKMEGDASASEISSEFPLVDSLRQRLESGHSMPAEVSEVLGNVLECQADQIREHLSHLTTAGLQELEGLSLEEGGLCVSAWLIETTSPDAIEAAQTVDAVVSLGVDPNLAVALVDRRRPPERISLEGERIRVGHWDGCDIVLPDSRLSPIHAEFVRDGANWRAVSTGGSPLVVEDALVASAPVRSGDVVHVGRYALHVGEEFLEVTSPSVSHALHLRGVSRHVAGHTILSDVSFSVLSGELVAVVGPSGSGKSTLLAALGGVFDEGEVLFDDTSWTALLEEQPTLAGEVPQDDIVHGALTVEESLRTGVALRNPRSEVGERDAIARRVSEELGLGKLRAARIGDPLQRGLSGGQRKRVNIAQELLGADTRAVLLDEPTSGLDPRSSAELCRLARRLADRGRMVFVVSHELSDALMSQVDHLLVMAEGGHLAWFGPPEDACRHFAVQHPSDLFDRLPDRPGKEWALRWQTSPSRQHWVVHRFASAERLVPSLPHSEQRAGLTTGQALPVLLARDLRLKIRDSGFRAVWLAQPLVVLAVVATVFTGATSGLVFLLVLASLWFGMSASVRDLLTDRVVWRREARLGLPATAWVMSRAGVTGGLVSLQCIALGLVAMWASPLGELGFDALGLVGAMWLCGLVGVATGMAISALWSRADAAFGTVVLLLLPQIAFSGILVPVDQMHPVAATLSNLTPIRYGFHLALVMGESLQYLRLGEWHERSVSGELFLMGLRPSGEGSLGLPVPTLVGILCAFIAGGLLVATLLHARNARRR